MVAGMEGGAAVGAALQAIEVKWSQEYEQALEHCLHGSHCQAGERFTIGKRKQPLFMITGALLPVWGAIQETVNRRDADVEIVRVNTSGGERLVGLRLKDSKQLKQVQTAVRDMIATRAQEQPQMAMPPCATEDMVGSSTPGSVVAASSLPSVRRSVGRYGRLDRPASKPRLSQYFDEDQFHDDGIETAAPPRCWCMCCV